MKGYSMKVRWKVFLLLSVVISFFACSSAYAQNKFKLKQGATGKLCLNCHSDFQEKLKEASVHTPVKLGNVQGATNRTHQPTISFWLKRRIKSASFAIVN